jgi:hypothetical protein
MGLLLFIPYAWAGEESVDVHPDTEKVLNNDPNWALQLPQDGHVTYRGVVNYDNAGISSPAIMYPAPNAAGLIAAIITHGLINESMRDSQKEKLQSDANLVLEPYKPVLDTFSYPDLMRRALEKTSASAIPRLVNASDNPEQKPLVASTPIFSLTQDQIAIVLDNEINITNPENPTGTHYRNVIRVVSIPRNTPDPQLLWTEQDGEKLKDESAQLVIESINIAIADSEATIDSGSIPYRTVRYREGSVEKIERAQIMSSKCGRLIIRTLRGAIMSVPTSQAEASQCASF